ncbi:MAG: hypothetical protein ACK46L_03090 [Synechococcaceae cyanobacterium]
MLRIVSPSTTSPTPINLSRSKEPQRIQAKQLGIGNPKNVASLQPQAGSAAAAIAAGLAAGEPYRGRRVEPGL